MKCRRRICANKTSRLRVKVNRRGKIESNVFSKLKFKIVVSITTMITFHFNFSDLYYW